LDLTYQTVALAFGLGLLGFVERARLARISSFWTDNWHALPRDD